VAIDKALARAERTEERWFFSEVLRTKANCSSCRVHRAPRNGSGRRSTGPEPGRPLVGAAERDEPRTAPPAGGGPPGAQVLAPVYGRFTEGFGTADLMTAKALLDTCAKARCRSR